MRTNLGKFLRKIRVEYGEPGPCMAAQLGTSWFHLFAVEHGKKLFPEQWFQIIQDNYALSPSEERILGQLVLESVCCLDNDYFMLSSPIDRFKYVSAIRFRRFQKVCRRILKSI